MAVKRAKTNLEKVMSRPTEGFERERLSLGCLFFKQRRAAEAVEGRAREDAWREAFSR